jgi:hypothetical protein
MNDIRQRFLVLYVDSTVNTDGAGQAYVMIRATDGSAFAGEKIIFHGAVSPGVVHEGDEISAEIDFRQPTYFVNILVEKSEFNESPNAIVQPAPFKMQKPPVIAEIVPQVDSLKHLVSNRLDFSQEDIRHLAERLIFLEEKYR